MTMIKLKTRDQADGRIFVSDGQGTSGSYPRDYHDQGQAHRSAARQFLAQLKGWPDAKVNVSKAFEDGFELTVTRKAVTPSRPAKPVAEVIRVARYLEGRRAASSDRAPNRITAVQIDPAAVEVRELLVSDLQALLDYIREA